MPAAEKRAASDGPAWPVPMMIASNLRFTVVKLTLLAGRAAVDDDHIEVAHRGDSFPACSATIYSAYQSGQFVSRCPVRFSYSPWAASARRSALARSAVDANAVSVAAIRPGSRVVTSCSNHPLPSGSRKEAN